MSPQERYNNDNNEELAAAAAATARGGSISPSDGVENRRPQRRRSKKRIKLFSESGMTEQERRDLRKNQRDLALNLRAGDFATMDDLETARKTNNNMFSNKVCYTREAVLDADNVELIATNYAQQVEKQVQVPRYDAHKLVQKLSARCTISNEEGSSFFNWKGLGVECGICFNALPERVSFLAGALDSDVTVKKKAVRKKREKVEDDDAEEIKPEDVQNNNSGDNTNKLSAMEKQMNKIKKTLRARTKEEKQNQPGGSEHPDVDGVQFLFNPQSFTQTVENIFNFGFLIKKAEAEIGVRPANTLGNGGGGGLYVAQRTNKEDDETEATQAVCSFTMRDWRRICEAHESQDCDLGLRKGSGGKKRAAAAAGSP